LDIYVINLDRSPERISEFFTVNRNLSATVSRYPAIDGRTFDLDSLVRQGLVTKHIVNPDMFSIGALGCALSNIALWDKAIGSGQSLTVCEDDAISTSVSIHNEEIPAQQGDGLLVSDLITGSKWSALNILLKEWQGCNPENPIPAHRGGFGSPIF
jgi:hypothetical protein